MKVANTLKAAMKLSEFIRWTALFLFAFGHITLHTADAKISDLRPSELREVMRIAKAISVVQPFLEEGKYLEYAYGIHKAALRYDIEPEVLISITQQETGFREDLPEGKAGERGICQIRKMWIKQPKFRAEFRKATIRDLHRPSKAFLFAAWILKGLKDNAISAKQTLPYWSFYNSVRFENRFKYFLAVNKNVSMLKKFESYINNVIDDSRGLAAPRPLVQYQVPRLPMKPRAETRIASRNVAAKPEIRTAAKEEDA